MKNKILRFITGLAVMVALLSMCALEGFYRDYALWALGLSGWWLSLFCYANRDNLEGR